MKPSNKKLTTRHGRPYPLGATPTTRGTNFAIYAREQSDVTLLLWPSSDKDHAPPVANPVEYRLDPTKNLSGQVWHVELTPFATGCLYQWRVAQPDPRWKSNLCLDPYARALHTPIGPDAFNARTSSYEPRAIVSGPADAFDWQDVPRPKVPWAETIIYELHVRGFTRDEAGNGGTFADVIARIPYLKALGVTAVELLPVMEFNEEEWSAKHPETGMHLCQYWGYSTVAFFAPMNRFARSGPNGTGAVRDFQYMVRELHRAGIEVILDVVYNHTAEMGNDFVGPGFYGMKQLAPFTYYHMRDGGQTFINHTGCGNTLNCNNTIVQDLILESLRYWAHDLGVDGFRFDLASILTRGPDDAEGMRTPPLIERIAKDPALRGVKLIAEPWDCGNLYLVGNFPHYGVFAEWNGKFRDCIRRFIKGDAGMVGEFATRLCGSQDLYDDGRHPFHSINFVTAHDGFTLRDLVSYDAKHNDANGEGNRDGEAHNLSWNCGVEGHTSDPGVNSLRERQIRNMLVALMVAAGTPMLNMGDEYGHTRHGNNNTWCQDGLLSWFDWKKAQTERDRLVLFTAGLVQLRRWCKTLQRDTFLSDRDVQWHGVQPFAPDWNSGYNFLALALKGDVELYIAFNAGGDMRDVQLPPNDYGWARLVDTSLEAERAFAKPGQERRLDGGSRYGMAPYSTLLARSMRGRGEMEMSMEGAFKIADVESVKSLNG